MGVKWKKNLRPKNRKPRKGIIRFIGSQILYLRVTREGIVKDQMKTIREQANPIMNIGVRKRSKGESV